jgi:pimeloyl-ACP methyl ester carboxylesterase
MGGFLAVSCAARYPEWIARVVLVDGGLRLGVEALAASTVDDVLRAVLGPALERLRRTFTNRASYHHFWREHPAFRDPGI